MAGTVVTKTKPLRYLLGKCMPTTKQAAARIRVKQLVFDENLRMYFPEYKFVFAWDPEQQCRTGDTVLIQTLLERKDKLTAHQVMKIIYPLGDITDPITDKKVVVGRFRDDVKAVNQLYGESPEAFDYGKEPPRGCLEGKRDFSHEIGTVKFHEDPANLIPHAL